MTMSNDEGRTLGAERWDYTWYITVWQSQQIAGFLVRGLEVPGNMSYMSATTAVFLNWHFEGCRVVSKQWLSF